MKNVTVTLQDSVAAWARVWAARHQTSVSRILGDLLTEKMRAEEGYRGAMDEFLATPPSALTTETKPDAPYPARDSLHER